MTEKKKAQIQDIPSWATSLWRKTNAEVQICPEAIYSVFSPLSYQKKAKMAQIDTLSWLLHRHLNLTAGLN